MDDDTQEAEGSLEDQVAKELAAIKRPRKEQRFGTFIFLLPLIVMTDPLSVANSQTNTPCGMRITPIRFYSSN
jgi:hypothetical protein